MMTGLLFMAGLAALIGFALVYASRKLADRPDPDFDKVVDALPGANCGGCGFPGCREYAHAVQKNPNLIGLCGPGGKDVAANLSEILHHQVPAIKRLAWVRCKGGEDCADKGDYHGIGSCKAASSLHQGQKSCDYGCLGFGDCVAACAYGAIRMGKKGYPVIDPQRCVACGKCVIACPKKIIIIREKKEKVPLVVIECVSNDPGKKTAQACRNGCIACGLCVKACPKSAIEIKENLAVIDYGKCIGCGRCVAVCPRKVISTIVR